MRNGTCTHGSATPARAGATLLRSISTPANAVLSACSLTFTHALYGVASVAGPLRAPQKTAVTRIGKVAMVLSRSRCRNWSGRGQDWRAYRGACGRERRARAKLRVWTPEAQR